MSLEDRLEAIPHHKVDLTGTPDDPRDIDPHRPEITISADWSDNRGAQINLHFGALWAQDNRWADLNVYEARQLAKAIVEIANAVEQACENQNEADYDRQQEQLMESGGGPNLIEQQQAAYKIKRGLP